MPVGNPRFGKSILAQSAFTSIMIAQRISSPHRLVDPSRTFHIQSLMGTLVVEDARSHCRSANCRVCKLRRTRDSLVCEECPGRSVLNVTRTGDVDHSLSIVFRPKFPP